MPLSRRALAAEFGGTAVLLATVVGSGIMGERLAAGNDAMALLANSLATASILYVLIAILGPVSGAHFNPALTLAMWAEGRIRRTDALAYAGLQLAGAVAGVWLAHLMFDLPVLQASPQLRASAGQWLSEIGATFGLVLSILMALRHRPEAVAAVVGLYIGAAYWFTASTAFANPAVTFARAWTDTFAGILPAHVPAFIACEMAGALLAFVAAHYMDTARAGG